VDPSTCYDGDSCGHRIGIDELMEVSAGDLLDIPAAFSRILRHMVVRRSEEQITAWSVEAAHVTDD
jgi:hypothetical protein